MQREKTTKTYLEENRLSVYIRKLILMNACKNAVVTRNVITQLVRHNFGKHN